MGVYEMILTVHQYQLIEQLKYNLALGSEDLPHNQKMNNKVAITKQPHNYGCSPRNLRTNTKSFGWMVTRLA